MAFTNTTNWFTPSPLPTSNPSKNPERICDLPEKARVLGRSAASFLHEVGRYMGDALLYGPIRPVLSVGKFSDPLGWV
jgi:hypothetical protein